MVSRGECSWMRRLLGAKKGAGGESRHLDDCPSQLTLILMCFMTYVYETSQECETALTSQY